MEMKQPHIVILPFPAQGHIKPMPCLVELFCHTGLHVTFVNTHHNHQRLTNLQSLSTRFPTLHLESISDGLPDDHPRSLQLFRELDFSIKSATKPLFRDLMVSLRQNSDGRPQVTCIIADGIMSFAIDVAEEFGIKVITFRTFSACSLWVYYCIPKLIEEGELPFGGDKDMDKPVTCIPGLENVFRHRELPSIFLERRRSSYSLLIIPGQRVF